jgi:hypothetical protein
MIDIEKANVLVCEKFMEAKPVAVSMGKAIEKVPGMKENMLLHAGPPVGWISAILLPKRARKSAVQGKSVQNCVDVGGRRIIEEKIRLERR